MSPDQLPESWRSALADEFAKPYFHQLQEFLAEERAEHKVFPPEADVFNAYKYAPFEEVKVLLLGQDPYHDDGQAHGLCFSVRPGDQAAAVAGEHVQGAEDRPRLQDPQQRLPRPLGRAGDHAAQRRADGPRPRAQLAQGPGLGDLHRRHHPGPRPTATDPVVFVLWGAYAQKKGKLIDAARHPVLTAAHPSPLSAKQVLRQPPVLRGQRAPWRSWARPPIDWQLPDL